MSSLPQNKMLEKLQYLLNSFDKKYVKELFEEGEKIGLFGIHPRENYSYDYEGYKYIITRYPLTPKIPPFLKPDPLNFGG